MHQQWWRSASRSLFATLPSTREIREKTSSYQKPAHTRNVAAEKGNTFVYISDKQLSEKTIQKRERSYEKRWRSETIDLAHEKLRLKNLSDVLNMPIRTHGRQCSKTEFALFSRDVLKSLGAAFEA